MSNYNRYLFKESKYKYIGVIALQLILAIINIGVTLSFFYEIGNVSLVLLNGVIQFINIVSYILFRTIYINGILLFKDNGINIFAVGKESRRRLLKIRLLQIAFFMIIQMSFAFIGMGIFSDNINSLKVLIFNYLESTIIFVSLAINDIAVINKFRRTYFEGMAEKLFLLTIVGMFSIPSTKMMIALGTFFMLSTIINLFIIIRGDGKSDRNKKFNL